MSECVRARVCVTGGGGWEREDMERENKKVKEGRKGKKKER